jgi:hypothetical protein
MGDPRDIQLGKVRVEFREIPNTHLTSTNHFRNPKLEGNTLVLPNDPKIQVHHFPKTTECVINSREKNAFGWGNPGALWVGQRNSKIFILPFSERAVKGMNGNREKFLEGLKPRRIRALEEKCPDVQATLYDLMWAIPLSSNCIDPSTMLLAAELFRPETAWEDSYQFPEGTIIQGQIRSFLHSNRYWAICEDVEINCTTQENRFLPGPHLVELCRHYMPWQTPPAELRT